MIINSARFEISNSTHSRCPQGMRHEYAFIGRSNVGKSSLINMLTGNSKLAKTSSTPGKTLLINHFLVNGEWYIVDLPGYGFAMRGKQQREQLETMIKGYILGREQMTNLFVLIDSRHEPMKIDIEFFNWLGENGVPFAIVFTKLDKLGNAGKSFLLCSLPQARMDAVKRSCSTISSSSTSFRSGLRRNDGCNGVKYTGSF